MERMEYANILAGDRTVKTGQFYFRTIGGASGIVAQAVTVKQ